MSPEREGPTLTTTRSPANSSAAQLRTGDVPDDGATYLKRGGRITAAERHRLPASDFAGSAEKESYPIPDKSHARNALARVSQHGSESLKAKVRAKVHAKYPDIGKDHD